MRDIIEAARGRWPDLLSTIAGLSAEQLTDEHQPCPLCGGTDRYRFDDLDGSGSWFCNQCGGKDGRGGAGNGMDLLMRRTGLSFADAARRIEQHLGLQPEPASKRRTKPHRIPETPPPDAPPPTLGRAVAQWCYRDAAGNQLFWIQRLNIPPKDGKPARKVFIHRVWLDGSWHYPRSRGENADDFTCEWPTPRPLYNLHLLAQHPDAKVLVAEGEKAADAASTLFPHAVAVSWPNGSKVVDLIDWAPLHGRDVILWPDNDDTGRAAMARIAEKLITKGGTIRVISPPADAPNGWDVADATWTPQEAAAFARQAIKPVQSVMTTWGTGPHEKTGPLPQSPVSPLAQPTVHPGPADPDPIKPSPGGYFTCLGFDVDGFYYQPHRTGQVVRLSRSSHTGTNLVALAPLGYWETLYQGKTGPNWTAAASDLFEQQARVGIYSPERIRGRGAWWDHGRSVLHLGNRLVVDGAERDITDRIEGSPFLYQRLSSLQGPADARPLTDEEAHLLGEIAERFQWEVPASGLLLAGWVTLAPICGALPWRPHAWLTAAAGSGKSAILDRYVTPLLGDMGLIVAGNTTEPGIRQALRADALPVVFDEAESNERTDQQRMQAILGLARVASSESKAHTLKGTPEGDTQRFTIRSMFLMSSIATSLKQGADKSRFAQLTLRNPTELPKAERTAHWEALDRDLERFISEETGRRLQARTISLIPTIRASIRVFTRVAAERFDSQRLGDQYGTLLAGAWSLQSSEVVTDEQARALIDQNNWEPYSQATEIPDERRCIQRILQHQVRVEGDKTVTRSIGELVEIALHREHDFNIEASLAQSTLGRNGIKADQSAVVISNNAEAIASILRDTPWSNCWPTVLTRLPGATKAGSIYFRGAGATSRAVRVPLDAVDRADQP
jgi:putative DNA primase/helicase